MSFHEVRFPTGISYGSRGGPQRRTQIVELASGYEQANQLWADSRRRYNAGYGVKSLNDLHAVIEFFEERRGRFHGFRWKDWADFKSVAPGAAISAIDQVIGTGDGAAVEFQLVKVYGSAFAPYSRTIRKPVQGTVQVAVEGVPATEGVDWTVDTATGIVTFSSPPDSGRTVTAGFEFDVPVRFDTDSLEIDLSQFEAGEVPDIPIVEIRL